MIPSIRSIIEHGNYQGRFAKDKERSDDIRAFHHFNADVELDGEVVEVGVSVAEDRYGNFFYNLNRNPIDLLLKRKTQILPRLEARGSEPSTDTDNGFYNGSIAQDDSEINLTIATKPLESRARTSTIPSVDESPSVRQRMQNMTSA